MGANELLFGLQETGVSDYRTLEDRMFLERLDERAKAYPWCGDGWSRHDRTIVSVCQFEGRAVCATLRVDFFGDSVQVGYDTTNQLTEDLDLADSRTEIIYGCSIAEMANIAADWVEHRLATK